VYKESKAEKNTTKNGDVKYDIVALDDGKVYVEASRNVINGTTLDAQRKDITKFFNALLDGDNSLDIHTIEGDILTITKAETADKARDNYKIVNEQRIKLSDEEFAVKLRVEAHIDEIAEVSRKIGQDGDKKNHTFAKDGFTYRRAYFKDFDGQYYEITLSIGHNGTVATVYNVGKIKGSVSPSAKIIAAVRSKPLGETTSNKKVPQKEENVKYSLSADTEGNKLTKAQQEYFKDSKVVDADGNLKVMYHGTPDGGFTVFKLPEFMNTLMSAQGAGFYFTDKKNAEQYTKAVNKSVRNGAKKQLYEVYLNITNPLEIKPNERTITKKQFKDILRQGNRDWFKTDWMPFFADGVKTENQKLDFETLLDKYTDKVFVRNKSDGDVLAEVTRAFRGGDETILNVMKSVLGRDGVRFTDRYGDIWVAWSAEQIKSTANTNPTADTDIRNSLSNGEQKQYGNYNVYGKDIALPEDIGPVREDIAPTVQPKALTEAEMFPDDNEPLSEVDAAAMNYEALWSMTDEDAPPVMEEPYTEDIEPSYISDPLKDKTWEEVGKRNVKAYSFEHPEVRPFFKQAAEGMLTDLLSNTLKGQKIYSWNDGLLTVTGQERWTSDAIAKLRDNAKMSYKDIERGLRAIIAGNGAENNAASPSLTSFTSL
jgi:uncharacterized protein YxjI